MFGYCFLVLRYSYAESRKWHLVSCASHIVLKEWVLVFSEFLSAQFIWKADLHPTGSRQCSLGFCVQKCLQNGLDPRHGWRARFVGVAVRATARPSNATLNLRFGWRGCCASKNRDAQISQVEVFVLRLLCLPDFSSRISSSWFSFFNKMTSETRPKADYFFPISSAQP